MWFEWDLGEWKIVLYRGIWINSCLRGLIQGLVIALSLHALASVRVEPHLLGLQQVAWDDFLVTQRMRIYWAWCLHQRSLEERFLSTRQKHNRVKAQRTCNDVSLIWAWAVWFLELGRGGSSGTFHVKTCPSKKRDSMLRIEGRSSRGPRH